MGQTELQNAMEALRVAYRDLGYDLSSSLAAKAPDLTAAIEYVLSAADTDHVEPPPLHPGDFAPEDLSDAHLYVDVDFDVIAPRKLSDVWQGRGDHDDPFVPQSPNEDLTNLPSVEYDHDLLARRMREDSDTNLKRG